jgi:MFS family permease
MTVAGRGGPAAPADDDRCPSGIAVAVGAAALVAAAVLGAALTPSPALRLGALVLAVAVCAAVFGDGRAALAVGALAWPIGNGFLVDRFGELRWHAGLDAGFVIGLLAAVAVGMTIAQIRREVHTRARMRPLTALLQAQPKPRIRPVEPLTRSGPVGSSRSPASAGWVLVERGDKCPT